MIPVESNVGKRIRGVKASASLKLFWPVSSRRFRQRIRGVKASASLKPPCACFLLRNQNHRIRGVKASASLKRPGFGVGYKHPFLDPRCKSLGLIEATSSEMWIWSFLRIRGVKASASLKRVHLYGPTKFVHLDPRCKSLGLIEA